MTSPLDVLLGAQVKDDGVAVTPRRYIDFRTGLTLVDNPATDSIQVSATGGGGGVLVGDVNGDADANVITKITGDTGDVEMIASSLLWGSPGNSQLKVNAVDGAIELWNNAILALKAHATAPTIANTGAITQVIGGVRHSVRTISSNIALDSTTKDFIGWVDASAPRTITLPTPSSGRTFLLVNVGASAVTIARSASELINGVAANYVVPVANCIVQIVTNGTDWFALPIFDGTGTYVTTARTISTTAPLTGGGDLTANRTLAINNATTGTVGVVQLAQDLGGTGALPTVVALTGTAGTVAMHGTSIVCDTNATNGATATALVIQASNASGTTSTGADLIARAGAGTSGLGKFRIDVGASIPVLEIYRNAFAGDATVINGKQRGLVFQNTIASSYVQFINNGSSADCLYFDSDLIRFRSGNGGSTKGRWASAGLRIGDDVAPTEKLEVAGNCLLGTTTSTHQIIGAVRKTFRNVTGNITIDTTTTDNYLLVDTSAARSITLPAATAGRSIKVKDKTGSANTNNITIVRAGSESIDGVVANYVYATNWGSFELFCDGTNWFIL